MRRPSPRRRTLSKRPKSGVGIGTGYPLGNGFTEPLHGRRNPVTRSGYGALLMRSATIALLSLLLLPAALAAPTRTVTAPAPVTALAFDAGRVAYASGRSAGDCNRVRLWNLSTRGVTQFPRPTSCVETSTGSGISGLA